MKSIERSPKGRTRGLLLAFALLAAIAAFGGLAASSPALAAGGAQLGSPAANRCVFAKQQAALQRMRAVTKCYQKAAAQGEQDPDVACVMKAEERFAADFQRAERGGSCVPATGDAGAVGHYADECAIGLFQVLPGECLPEGAACGSIGYCCSPFVCKGAIGQPPTCR